MGEQESDTFVRIRSLARTTCVLDFGGDVGVCNRKTLGAFGRDQAGAPELSTVLLVSLVSIPLILVAVAIAAFAYKQFDIRVDEAEDMDATAPISQPLQEAGSMSPGVLKNN